MTHRLRTALVPLTLLPLLAVGSAWGTDGNSTRISIDCHDFGLANTSTPDDVIFELWYGGKKQETKRLDFNDAIPNAADPGTCPLWVAPGSVGPQVIFSKRPDTYEESEGMHIRVKAGGDNAFWIDQMQVQSVWGNESYGVDGKSGWCLSTDPNDSFGSDRQDGKCKSCIKVPFDDSGVKGC